MRPFLTNDNKMLWLALLARDTGIPASKRLGIEDEVVAWDFDLAISYRLFLLRIEEQKSLAKRIAMEVGRAMFGSKDEDDPSEKYVDQNTEAW